jgi:hypothetical protein
LVFKIQAPLLHTLRGIYRARAGEGRGEASISGMLCFLLLLRFSFVPVFSNLALTMMLGSISKFLGFGSWRVQSKSSKTVKRTWTRMFKLLLFWHLRCLRLLNTQTSSMENPDAPSSVIHHSSYNVCGERRKHLLLGSYNT